MLGSGNAIGREGERRGAASVPTRSSGGRLAEGGEISGGIVTELAHEATPPRARCSRRSGGGSGTAWSAW